MILSDRRRVLVLDWNLLEIRREETCGRFGARKVLNLTFLLRKLGLPLFLIVVPQCGRQSDQDYAGAKHAQNATR